MERCSKCNGVMLEMKLKKTVLPDTEKRQIFKCSRCGFYMEKQRVFTSGRYEENIQEFKRNRH